jgi:hypothetical protein
MRIGLDQKNPELAPSSEWQKRGRPIPMRRALVLIVAVVAVGWAPATAAMPPAHEQLGEPWILEDGGSRLPSIFRESGLEDSMSRERDRVGTAQNRRTVSGTIRLFGSGLEDGAPVRPPSVFHQSGLEGLTSVRAAHSEVVGVRFGSGLEDNAPVRSADVFHQSGF